MAKAYWISSYREISDPAKLNAYAQLAGPAIESGGGRFLARATAAKAYEDGKTAMGFVAAFAYFNVAMIRLDTGTVIAEQRVVASSPYTTPNSINAEDVWGGMPATERVRMVRELVGREVRAVIPKLLAESR